MSEITDRQKARMVALATLDNDEIATRVGVSASSVSKYLSQYAKELQAADNPDYVFYVWTLPLFTGSQDSQFTQYMAEALAGM